MNITAICAIAWAVGYIVFASYLLLATTITGVGRFWLIVLGAAGWPVMIPGLLVLRSLDAKPETPDLRRDNLDPAATYTLVTTLLELGVTTRAQATDDTILGVAAENHLPVPTPADFDRIRNLLTCPSA